jgi:hypothetical protein
VVVVAYGIYKLARENAEIPISADLATKAQAPPPANDTQDRFLDGLSVHSRQ